MARLTILSNDDFDKLYKIPQFNDEERQLVFELDEEDKKYIGTLKNISEKIHYVLHLGYFRISQCFFSCTFQKAKDDVKFLINTYFPKASFPAKELSTRKSYSNNQALLKRHDMAQHSKVFEKKVSAHLKSLVKQHAVPKYLFDSILEYYQLHKVVRPGYSTLQDLISSACNNEKLRINNKLYNIMGEPIRNSLDSLLKKNDLFYQLTLIKKDQKDFSTTEIRSTVEKHNMLSEIYSSSIDIIKQLDISEQNVAHYAELAEQYSVYQLRLLKPYNLARLYILCYAYRRFLKINDHLVASFVHRVNGYIHDADTYQKDEIYNAKIIDKDTRNSAADILSLHTDKKITDTELRKKPFTIVPENEFQQFIQKIRKPHMSPDYYRWKYYVDQVHAIKRNIRSNFRVLNFQSKSADLEKAISFLTTHFDSKKSVDDYNFKDIPLKFISSSLNRYVITKTRSKISKRKVKSINFKAYEFMVYFHIEKSLKNGSVTIKDSLTYKSLGDELLSQKHWDNNKVDILKEIESQLLSCDISAVIDKLKPLLNSRYKEVNERIDSGANNKIKIKYNKKEELISWRMPYKKAEDKINNPYYDSMDITSFSQIIKFANHHTNFMKGFTHVLPTYIKTQAKEPAVAACLVSKATGNDIYRMKDMSDVNEKVLISTYNSFIRYHTLTSSSDIVMDTLSKLPIFEKYTLSDYGIHASVDGQKLETRYNTIKARHSSKYYGLGKGVSAYTLFANCLPICTKIIGANEHESHYLLDALKNNTSEIKIAAVSGDMHSINRINFILLYIFGYRFMPRFTKLDQKARNNLVCFGNPNKYKNCVIKPAKKVNEDLILKESDNVLRVFATLALKKNTQSNIVRKLSSHKTNETIKALIELDKIIMSLYILDYIDDEEMRKCVHRALNRGESYHQLRSAIAKVSGKKLIGKNEIELTINNECARFLAICIIFYNAFLLSAIYDYCKSKNMTEECDKIIRLSPVAWQHINFVGKYEFMTNVNMPNLDDIKEHMISNLDKVVVVVNKKKVAKSKKT